MMVPTSDSDAQPSSSEAASTALRNFDQSRVHRAARCSGRPTSAWAPRRPLHRAGQVVGVDELVAGGHERLGRLALAEPEHRETTPVRPPAGEVALAGDDAEAVQPCRVEQDPASITKAASVRTFLPVVYANCWIGYDGLGRQVVARPRADSSPSSSPYALDVRGAVLDDLGQQPLDDRRLGIVGVDEHRQLGRVVADRCPCRPLAYAMSAR